MRENNKLGQRRATSDAFVYTVAQLGNIASLKDAFCLNKGYENNRDWHYRTLHPLVSSRLI